MRALANRDSLESDQVQLLMRNADQILAIVTAAFGDELFKPESFEAACSTAATDDQELACRWHQIAEAARKLDNHAAVDPAWISEMSKVSPFPSPFTWYGTAINDLCSGSMVPRVL